MTPAEQAYAFISMALCGFALGAAYDLLSLVCALTGGGKMLRSALDLLFGFVCAAAAVACGLLLGTNPFRLYVFAAEASGFALYMLSVGMIVRILKKKLHGMTKKV